MLSLSMRLRQGFKPKVSQRQYLLNDERLGRGITVRRFFEELLFTPRVFTKFYPGRRCGSGTKTGASEGGTLQGNVPSASISKSGGKKGKGCSGGGGGDGGGKKDNNDPDSMTVGLMIGTGAVLGVLFGLFQIDQRIKRPEISWQWFRTYYLSHDKVEKVVVVNKSVANVILRNRSSPYSSVAGAVNLHSAFPEESGFPLDDKSSGDISNSSRVTGSHSDGIYRSNPDESSSKTINISKRPPSGSVANSTVPRSREPRFCIGSVESFERKMEEAQEAMGKDPKDFVPVVYQSNPELIQELIQVSPFFLVVGILLWTMRSVGGGTRGGPMANIFKVGKSNAKMIKKEDVKVTFKDVAGCDEAKREVMEFVEFLKAPEKFSTLGARIPRGALLAGPPGTGKTLLAKATAGEASVPFFSMSGSDFVEMFVGVGASRVRDLFKEARANAPCIVFIDEIDAVGRVRGKSGQGGNDERESTLNQLLIEMDGFNTDENVILLAGTNRADMLDSALTRPGRFDRTINVELPDIKGRKAIFDVHLRNITLDGSIYDYSPRLAALTPGFSGADIANICNEAAIHAGRVSKKAVDMVDFEKATDRVIGGLESHRIISPEERRIVAFHEAGHAVAGWYLEHAAPLLKVTIVSRSKGPLGYAQYLPNEISLRTKDQISDIICMALAGRAAETVHFGRYTTGAADDLRKVTQIIYEMVQVYGMNEKVGQLSFPKQDGQWPQERIYSEGTAETMDEEARALVEDLYKRTIELMENHKEDVRTVAELLLKQETISHTDVAKLIGDRKFSAGAEYDEFVSVNKRMNSRSSNNGSSSNSSQVMVDGNEGRNDDAEAAAATAAAVVADYGGSTATTEDVILGAFAARDTKEVGQEEKRDK